MSQRLRQCLLASALAGGLLASSIATAAAQDGGATSNAAQAPSATVTGNSDGGPATGTGADTANTATSTTPTGTPPATQPASSTTVAGPTTTTPAGTPGTTPAVDAAVQASGSQVPPAAYLTGEDRIPADEIETFLTQPRSFIDEQPIVAERVSARTERLVGTDQRTVPPIIAVAVAPETSAEQRAMIAVGMARATRAAEPVAPEYAAYLQEAVALSGSEGFIAAYNVAFQTSEIETASIGAGGPGSGASASGGTLSGGGDSGISGAIGGDDVVAQTSPSPTSFGGRSVALTTNGNNGTGTTTAAGTNGTTTVVIVRCTDPSPTDPRCAL